MNFDFVNVLKVGLISRLARFGVLLHDRHHIVVSCELKQNEIRSVDFEVVGALQRMTHLFLSIVSHDASLVDGVN